MSILHFFHLPRRFVVWVTYLGMVFTVVVSGTANAAPQSRHIYVLAIGHNDAPTQSTAERLEKLAFADDDAASFVQYWNDVSRDILLLGVPDDDTQELYPNITVNAKPATIDNLRLGVRRLAGQLNKDRQNGLDSVVLVFYSGHGVLDPQHGPALTLADALLTRQILYDEVLTPLVASYVHLFVDACHAEAVVRPRGERESLGHLSVGDVRAWRSALTLDRFPYVGAIVATTTKQQAHEWTTLRHGVFTFELLSGLRGAADANRDGGIDYSELGAFISAANKSIPNPDGRPAVIIRPPSLDRDVKIVRLADLPNVAYLQGRPSSLGRFFVEDARGNQLIGMYGEKDFRVALALPAERPLFVRASRGEAAIKLRPNQRKRFAQLRFKKHRALARGSLDRAFSIGLLATPFGPSYYNGFVAAADMNRGVIDLGLEIGVAPSVWPAYGTWIAAGIFAITSASMGGVALYAKDKWQTTDLEQKADEAKSLYNASRIAFWSALVATVATSIMGLTLYPWAESSPEGSFDEMGVSVIWRW